MVSIQEYINNRPKLDIISTSYVLTRCAAVYLYAGGVTKKSDSSTSKKFFSAYENFALKAAEILTKKGKFSENEASNNVMRNLSLMSKNYSKDGNENYARSGNYIMDSYIAADIKQCNNIEL